MTERKLTFAEEEIKETGETKKEQNTPWRR